MAHLVAGIWDFSRSLLPLVNDTTGSESKSVAHHIGRTVVSGLNRDVGRFKQSVAISSNLQHIEWKDGIGTVNKIALHFTGELCGDGGLPKSNEWAQSPLWHHKISGSRVEKRCTSRVRQPLLRLDSLLIGCLCRNSSLKSCHVPWTFVSV